MARGIILSSQTTTGTATSLLVSFPKVRIKKCKLSSRFLLRHQYHPRPGSGPLACCFCENSSVQDSIDMSKYKETFSRRMAMAGLKPHHRIALGVSGGPDSMALCALTAAWKIADLNATGTGNDGIIDGLLAIIVDHGLRAESKHEANIVYRRVSEMGIKCQIAPCDWSNGRPRQGHLQKAAREMRYQTFQKVCAQNQIGVLLIAHHSDDQAELFILRLSRNSGVLGLAGMPFTSQIFSTYTLDYGKFPVNHGILLVRPLLEFSKEDMYKICQGSSRDWVEDPTNQSPLFARNRIRMSLNDLSSYAFKSELRAVISACQIARSFIDQICRNLVSQAVVIVNHGYAVIDLRILNPSKIVDICLSKFISVVLQFISQRQGPVRGSAMKLLLDYFRTFPCKNSLTAAGCYLCPDPGSRGSRVLICCSVDYPVPLKMEVLQSCSHRDQEYYVANGLREILEDQKSYTSRLVPDASDVHFLDVTSELVLTEAKRLNLISESTYRNILVLQKEETNRFKSKAEAIPDSGSKHAVEIDSMFGKSLQPDQLCYFMDRFFLTWKLNDNIAGDAFSGLANSDMDSSGQNFYCCMVDHNAALELRHMIESDWLYLAKLSKYLPSKDLQQLEVMPTNGTKQMMEKTSCLEYASASARRALLLLKSIPVAARRSLPVLVNQQPVLVNQQRQLLSIPSVKFSHCPCLMVHVEFRPRVPLGGGHSSFI